jgi:hypothetical protein
VPGYPFFRKNLVQASLPEEPRTGFPSHRPIDQLCPVGRGRVPSYPSACKTTHKSDVGHYRCPRGAEVPGYPFFRKNLVRASPSNGEMAFPPCSPRQLLAPTVRVSASARAMISSGSLKIAPKNYRTRRARMVARGT